MLQVINYSEKAIALVGDTKEIKEQLKAIGGRFNPKLTCGAGWIFSKKVEDKVNAIVNGGHVEQSEQVKQTKKNKTSHGVNVGDIFHMQWGYEQTNNNFFQVIALVGSSSARVREVKLKLKERKSCGGMAEDQVFFIPENGELSDYSERSHWIDDQQNGDVKRIKLGSICLGRGYSADRVQGGEIKVYESWYA